MSIERQAAVADSGGPFPMAVADSGDRVVAVGRSGRPAGTRSRRADQARPTQVTDTAWTDVAGSGADRVAGLAALLGAPPHDAADDVLSLAARQRAVFAALTRLYAASGDATPETAADAGGVVIAPRALVAAILGDAAGDAAAGRAGKAWTDAIGHALQRLASAGVTVRAAADWRLPHYVDPLALRRIGAARFVARMMQWWRADRLRLHDAPEADDAYLAPEQPQAEARAAALLQAACAMPGAGDGGADEAATLAARYGRRCALEWRDAAAWLAFNRAFGVGDAGVPELLLAHLRALARDVALAEVLGPDPDDAARRLIARARHDGIGAAEAQALAALYRQSSGAARTPLGRSATAFTPPPWRGPVPLPGDAMARLAAYELSFTRATPALSDLAATQAGMAYIARLDPADADDRARAARADLCLGVAMRGIAAAAHDAIVDRADLLPGRMAGAVSRAQGLWCRRQILRDALGLDIQAALADLADRPLAQLPDAIRRRAARYDIAAAGWDILRARSLVRVAAGTAPFIEPSFLAEDSEAAARAVAAQLVAALAIEPRTLVPDDNEVNRAAWSTSSAATSRADDADTAPAWASVAPVATWVMLGMGALDEVARPDGAWFKGQYLAGMAALLTALGGLSLQLGNVAAGAAPEPMDEAHERFWTRALLHSGGGRVLAAFLADAGRDSAAAMRHGYDHYYTRLAVDRLVWDALQKMADPDDYPGTFERAEERARTARDAGFWWEPVEASSDLSAVSAQEQLPS